MKPDTHPPLDRKTLLMMLALLVAELTSTFEVGMLYSALSKMYGTFNDPVGVGWLITSFLLVGAASTAVCGRLGDMLGRGRVMLVLLFCAGIGSVISALSTTLPWIIFGRAVQGMSAAMMALCIGLVREHLPPSRVALGVGVITATATVGVGVGMVLGGVIVDNLTWPWLFVCSAALAFASMALVVAFVPLTKGAGFSSDVDIVGGILFAPAVAGILFAVTRVKSWGWWDGRTLTWIGSGIVVLILWVFYELRHKNPLINVRLFKQRQVALTYLAMALFAFGTSQLMQVILLLLQQPEWTLVGFGVSATVAAMLKFPSLAMSVVAAPWSGSIAGKHGARRAMLVGAVLVALGWIGMTAYHNAIWLIITMLFLISFGGAMMYAAMPNLLIEAVPADRTSEAIGLLHVMRTTFTAIGAQVVAFTLATSTVSDLARGPGSYPTADAYLLTFIFITAVALLTLLVTITLPRRDSREHVDAPVAKAAT